MTVSFPVGEGMRNKGAPGEGEGTLPTMILKALTGQRADPGMEGRGI
jgi:hypothetical protein